MPETLLDPKLASSGEPNETPFHVAMKIDKPVWEWFEEKENERLRIRFGMAMEGAKLAADPNAVLEGTFRMLSTCLSSSLFFLIVGADCRYVRLRLGRPEAGRCHCRCRWRNWQSVDDTCPESFTSPFRYSRQRCCRKGRCRGGSYYGGCPNSVLILTITSSTGTETYRVTSRLVESSSRVRDIFGGRPHHTDV